MAGLPDRPLWEVNDSGTEKPPAFGSVTPVEFVQATEDTAADSAGNSGYVGLAGVRAVVTRSNLKHVRGQEISLLPWQRRVMAPPACNRSNVERAVAELQAVWWVYTEEKRSNALVPDHPLDTPMIRLEVVHSRPYLRTREPYTFSLPHYLHDPHTARVFIGVQHAYAKKRIRQELELDLPQEITSQIKVKRLPRLVQVNNSTEAKIDLRNSYDIFLVDYSSKNLGYFNNFGRKFKYPLRLSGDVGKDVAQAYKTGQLQPRDDIWWHGVVARVGMKTERIVDNVESAINQICDFFPDVAHIRVAVDGLPKAFKLSVFCGPNAITNSDLKAPYRVQSGRIKPFPTITTDFDFFSNHRDVERLGRNIYK